MKRNELQIAQPNIDEVSRRLQNREEVPIEQLHEATKREIRNATNWISGMQGPVLVSDIYDTKLLLGGRKSSLTL